MVNDPWHVFSNDAVQVVFVDSNLTFVPLDNEFHWECLTPVWPCDAGLALAAPHEDIYSGLWGYNSALSCVAIGGVFYVITWQTHLLAVICGKIDNQRDSLR